MVLTVSPSPAPNTTCAYDMLAELERAHSSDSRPAYLRLPLRPFSAPSFSPRPTRPRPASAGSSPPSPATGPLIPRPRLRLLHPAPAPRGHARSRLRPRPFWPCSARRPSSAPPLSRPAFCLGPTPGVPPRPLYPGPTFRPGPAPGPLAFCQAPPLGPNLPPRPAQRRAAPAPPVSGPFQARWHRANSSTTSVALDARGPPQEARPRPPRPAQVSGGTPAAVRPRAPANPLWTPPGLRAGGRSRGGGGAL